MPIVRRNPPTWAVHMIYLVPSDFVLRDRFGAQIDQTAFMAGVEASLLRVRQFYWDLTGGETFDVVPSTFFRISKTTAQVFSEYVTWENTIKAGVAEMAAQGHAHLGPNRLMLIATPLDLEGGAIAVAATDLGSSWWPWGAAFGAGQNPLIFAGEMPRLASGVATLASTALSTSTVLTVEPGGGRVLAVAARFNRARSRVESVTSTTTFVLSDVSWAQADMDAVIWPYGQDPTVANAESVLITAVNAATKTVTVQRARYGTTAIAVTGGGVTGGGSCIAQRMGYARIWRPPASPEAAGAECVYISFINGDAITVFRNEEDAWFAGAAPPARDLLVGDNIVATDAPSGNFYQRIESAQGGIAHELGHNFGAKWWNPTEVKNFQVVENGVVVTKDRSATEAGRKSVDAVQGQDWWEHEVHTPDNPLTPGNWDGIMMSYWGFPFGNVPAAMAQPNEVERFQQGPYLRAQPYPTQATQVTADAFRASDGPVAALPTEAQPTMSYAVQPVIVLASNSVPTLTDAELIANLTASLVNVQNYYTAQASLTFSFRAPVITRHADTEATHNDDPGYGIFERATAEAAVPQGANEDLLYAIFAWYPQPGESTDRAAWRGNAWAYANGPMYMSDSGARRLCGDVPDTLVAGSAPGTTGTLIVVSSGTGMRLSRNADVPAPPISARIWGPTGSFDDPATYELVTITAINTDTLTVIRGAGGTARSIAVGDRIAFAPSGATVAANLAVARGALAHELGHGFHLPHPWDNAEDPGPTDSTATPRLMGNGFRQYPSSLLTAYETAKMTQPANPPWVTSDSVGHLVVPVVWFAADTTYDQAAFIANVDAKTLQVRQYFYDKLGGWTFDVGPTLFYRSPLTYAQCRSTYGALGLWATGMRDAEAATAGLDLENSKRYYCQITPVMLKGLDGNPTNAYGSTVTSSFLWGTPHSVPGALILPAGTGRHLGSSGTNYLPVEEDETTGSTVAYTNSEHLYQAVFAHELVHGFAAKQPSGPLGPDPQHDFSTPQNLMGAIVGLSYNTLTAEQVALIKTSPFITQRATRPT